VLADDPILRQQLLSADTNNDGKIDPREFDGVGGSALWAILDADRDRAVTREEVQRNLPKFLAVRAVNGGGRTPQPSTGLVPLTDLKSRTYEDLVSGGGTVGRSSAKNRRGNPQVVATNRRSLTIRQRERHHWLSVEVALP
jgi:hypothetical protein